MTKIASAAVSAGSSVIRARPRPVTALATALRQRAVLGEVEHRPWPLPEGAWFMGQSWLHLLFAHWRVDTEALRRVMPPQIPLDLYDGDAWLGITPFRVEGLRLRGTPPPPRISRFPELNVRTYVEYEGKPGIYFFSLDAASRAAVIAARRAYRLPYFLARMSHRSAEGGFEVRSKRIASDGPPARFESRYAPTGRPFNAGPGSLEHWLTERYCLYTLAEGGTVQRAEIHHPPWPLRPASGEIELNSMTEGIGVELPGDPLLHYSERQDVVLWTIEPV